MCPDLSISRASIVNLDRVAWRRCLQITGSSDEFIYVNLHIIDYLFTNLHMYSENTFQTEKLFNDHVISWRCSFLENWHHRRCLIKILIVIKCDFDENLKGEVEIDK